MAGHMPVNRNRAGSYVQRIDDGSSLRADMILVLGTASAM